MSASENVVSGKRKAVDVNDGGMKKKKLDFMIEKAALEKYDLEELKEIAYELHARNQVLTDHKKALMEELEVVRAQLTSSQKDLADMMEKASVEKREFDYWFSMIEGKFGQLEEEIAKVANNDRKKRFEKDLEKDDEPTLKDLEDLEKDFVNSILCAERRQMALSS